MRIIVLVFVLFWHSLASASDYYWAKNVSSTPYSTPEAFCRSLEKTSSGRVYTYSSYAINGYSVKCWMTETRTSSGSVAIVDKDLYGAYFHGARFGDSCPLAAEYNPSTGACDAPEPNLCEAAAGASTTYSVQTQLDADAPRTIDVGGCEATFSFTICKNKTDGTASCSGKATITGNKTETVTGPIAGEGVECSGADCEKDAPQPIYETIPCDYTIDESGYKVCSSSTTYSKPGTTKCGEVNGTWTCVESPKSVSTDKKVESKVEEVSNIDGSTTVKQTDKTTTTTCEGIRNCTTKDSTTTKEGGTNPDGTPKGESEKCTGSNCGVPDEIKDDVPGEEEEGEEGSDPVITELKKPGEAGNFDDANAEWDQKLEDAKLELKEKIADLGSLFQPIAEINLASGSGTIGCGETFSVLGQTMAFCPGKYEKQLQPIALAILFICAVIALFIIFRPESK